MKCYDLSLLYIAHILQCYFTNIWSFIPVPVKQIGKWTIELLRTDNKPKRNNVQLNNVHFLWYIWCVRNNCVKMDSDTADVAM